MKLIDDQGNLFGYVNVLDALVVFFVVAVLGAGTALVLQPSSEPDPPSQSTTNATLDLGSQPSYIVSSLEEGDTYSPGGTARLTVTDVHLQPGANESTDVVLRVELQGDTTGSSLSYDGEPPRLGRTLDLVTDLYQVKGTVTDIGGGNAVPTAERHVLVSTTLDGRTAEAIQAGDAFTFRERTLGTVQSVAVYGTTSPDRKRALLGLALQARQTDDGAQFAGTVLKEGSTVPFRTEDYELAGTVRRVGTTEPRGDPATRTVTLQLRDAPPELAGVIRAGMSETANGETLARITDVEREDATVVLTSEDGQIFERDHPVNRDLTVTADLAVRERATEVTFKGRTLQRGSTVVLDLGSVTVEATVASV